MKTCACCGETKTTRDFSYNCKSHCYSPNCRECGLWLKLLRQAFGSGPRNLAKTREYQREYARKQRQAPVRALYKAFGITL